MNNICDNIYEVKNLFKAPLAVMIGAGLSVPMPTALPLTREIVESLMALDWFEGDEKFPITDEAIINNIAKMRLEHLLSVYYEWGQPDIGKLLVQFREADYNWYHRQIAKLVTLTPHGWGIAHDKKQKFGVNSSFKSVTIGFLWY